LFTLMPYRILPHRRATIYSPPTTVVREQAKGEPSRWRQAMAAARITR